jgi:hypothetical protein
MRSSLNKIGHASLATVFVTAAVCSLPIAASAQTSAASSGKITASARTVAASMQQELAIQRDERGRRPVSRRRGSSPGLISNRERVRWFTESTVGPGMLSAAASGAAWGTMRHDADDYYGTGSKGFGQRYAVRMGDAVLRNGLEAGVGTIWHEDPRYVRSRGDRRAFTRVGYVVRRSVIAPRPDGHYAPAYARYAAIVGSGFLSNAWRPQSERSVNDAMLRSASGFAGTIAGNVFLEFWPDIKRGVSRHVLRRTH